jgi:hypothetical protein
VWEDGQQRGRSACPRSAILADGLQTSSGIEHGATARARRASQWERTRTCRPRSWDFRALRATIWTFAAETQDNLRGRKLVEGNMSVHQWLLMISTHAQRHILQIKEIKDAAAFPKGKQRVRTDAVS